MPQVVVFRRCGDSWWRVCHEALGFLSVLAIITERTKTEAGGRVGVLKYRDDAKRFEARVICALKRKAMMVCRKHHCHMTTEDGHDRSHRLTLRIRLGRDILLRCRLAGEVSERWRLGDS
jgi:hypothetical protein